MKKYSIFSILLIVLTGWACEREIEVPLPEHTPKLVVNSLTKSGEPFRVFVSRSFDLDEKVRQVDLYIPDAKVELWRDGELVETLTFTQNDTTQQFGYFSRETALPGSQYELVVSHPQYETVRQKMLLPGKPELEIIAFDRAAGISKDGKPLMQIKLNIQDAPDTANYYSLRAIMWYKNEDPNELDWGLVPLWEAAGSSTNFTRHGLSIVSDEQFDGTTTELIFEGEMFAEEEPGYELDRMYIEVQSWNEAGYRMGAEYYEHVYSQRFIDFDLSVLTMSPLPMFSNAEGGFGIFGGYTVKQDTLFF